MFKPIQEHCVTYSTGPLRAISLTVEEPEPGAFRWILLENNLQGEWTELSAARTPSTTYAMAVSQGLLALQNLVVDLDIGPRAAPVDTGKGVGPGHFFGFGPV
jgi:hypothetical protein